MVRKINTKKMLIYMLFNITIFLQVSEQCVSRQEFDTLKEQLSRSTVAVNTEVVTCQNHTIIILKQGNPSKQNIDTYELQQFKHMSYNTHELREGPYNKYKQRVVGEEWSDMPECTPKKVRVFLLFKSHLWLK